MPPDDPSLSPRPEPDVDADDVLDDGPVPETAVAAYAQAVTSAWLVGVAALEHGDVGEHAIDDEVREYLHHVGDGDLLAAALAALLEWATNAAQIAFAHGDERDDVADAVRGLDTVARRLADVVCDAAEDLEEGLVGLADTARELAVEPSALAEALAEVTWRVVWLAIEATAGEQPWFATLALLDPRTPARR